jgi:hypothetical protein
MSFTPSHHPSIQLGLLNQTSKESLTLMIQVLCRIRIKYSNVDVVLEPGKSLELPDDKGHKLLQLAQGKVRLMEEPAISAGDVVEWDSPLFGLLRGYLIAVQNNHAVVFHPLTEAPATIPFQWVMKRPTTPNELVPIDGVRHLFAPVSDSMTPLRRNRAK